MSESKHTDGEWFSEGPDYFGDYSIISSEHQEAIAAVIAYERDAQEVAANAGLIRPDWLPDDAMPVEDAPRYAATGSTRWGELYGAGGRIGVGLASPDSTGRWRTTATITPVLWWRPRPGKDLADYADGKQKPGE